MMKITYLIILISLLLSGCSKKMDSLCDIQQDPKDKCEGVYLGAEFDKKTKQCESVSWGCNEPPFKNVNECKKQCE